MRVVKSFLASTSLFFLLSCAQNGNVTVGGTPMDDAAFITAATVIHGLEATDIAIGEFLIARHKAACNHLAPAVKQTDHACITATGWLKTNATVYTPPILLAITTAREELKIAAVHPAKTTHEKMQKVIEMLRVALAPAIAWATQLGWATPMVKGN